MRSKATTPTGDRSYDVQEYWTRVANEIARRPAGSVLAGDSDPLMRYRREVLLNRFLRNLSIAGRSVLELGCGPGGNLVEMSAGSPSRLVGCDVSPAMLDLARRNTSGNPNIELYETDGRKLPFADGEFEVGLTVTVLQHNHDEQLAQILSELARVTARTLVLVEDTYRHRRASYSHVRRTVGDYAGYASVHGFTLVQARVLDIVATDALRTTVDRSFRLYRRLSRRRQAPREEGQPFPPPIPALETAALVVTRQLDRVVPQRAGLTMMTFQRDIAGA